MNRTELLDGLYSARSELLRLIMASARVQVEPDKLRQLVQRRDAITATINALIDAEVLASVGDIDTACKQIEAASSQLHDLSNIADDIDKAIGYGAEVLNAATSVLTALPK